MQDFLAEEEEEELESDTENPERESEELEPDLLAIESIEHTDSYHLQLQRNSEGVIKVVDAEDSLASLSNTEDAEQLDTANVEQKFNDMQQMLEDQNEVQTTSSDVTKVVANVFNKGAVDVKNSASPKSMASGEEKERSVAESFEMLVAERSTASDIVSQAMARAVERTTTPVWKQTLMYSVWP